MGVCNVNAIVRLKDGMRKRSGLGWRAWREKGGGEREKGGGTGSGGRKGKGGWERGIPEAGEGMAGWVPQELPRGKDNAQESRDC